ncbi:hypothetical protein HHI36_003692 [Cryptolaemus montrouzieri]
MKRSFRNTAKVLGNIVPFNLSDIGEGIREVSIKQWYIKEGDKVSQFDDICEVQSDKASVTITSRYDGIIKKIHYGINQTAYVGKPLIDIEVEGQDAEETKKSDDKNDTKIEKNSYEDDNYALCIPSVRRLARQYKIDLKNIEGTGKKSRILKEDILRYLKKDESKPDVLKEVTSNEETIKLQSFQKAMLQTMTASLKIPHFMYTEEVSITKLSQLRKSLNSSGQLNMKLSFMPFFIKAVSLALSEYPILNSSLNVEEESVTIKKYHNIGIAMDTKIGLVVPVIRDVQNIGVLKIAGEIKRLMEHGKNGNFSVDDLNGGSFTVSNIGSIGGVHASPVILSSQVAIVAIGASKTLPRFDKDLKIVPEEIVNMSGSADHRIIDGATMANFLNLVKKYIENPYLLMLKS